MPDDRSDEASASDAAADLGPGDLSTRGLPTARRGYEKKAVEALIADVIDRWGALHAAHEELLDEVSKVGGADHLAHELAAIGEEVSRILGAANEAAESLRRRARDDAERLRSEAHAEAEAAQAEAARKVERLLAEAEEQAFELRRSAWEQATLLIESADATARGRIEAAKEEQLRLRAEGEREAHRRLAKTRKEVEDLARSARLDAEQHVRSARALADEILARAEAGERAAVDPDEVRDDIERLRAGLTISDIAVLPAEPAPAPDAVEMDTPEPSDEEALSDSLVAEVSRLRNSSAASDDEAAAGDTSGSPVLEEIGTLFDALRTTAEQPVVEPAADSGGPLAARERRIMGVHNAALREVKRRITDLQEQALEGVRGSGWTPSSESVGSDLAALLDPHITRAATLGAQAASSETGVVERPRPSGRLGGLVSSMAADLASGLRSALSSATGGPEETAATLSRVFRAWRTDEAERWVAMILIAAFNDAYLASLADGGFDRVKGVPSGSPCRDCLGASAAEWDPAQPPSDGRIPPVDPDCRCGVHVVTGSG